MTDKIDFWNVVARQKLGIPNWEWCISEALGDWKTPGPCDLLLEGGVPTRTYTRGPRKGRHDWRGVPRTKLVVTPAEIKAAHAAYERETGNCARCQGEGLVVNGWSAATGTSYRDCRGCDATGKAKCEPA